VYDQITVNARFGRERKTPTALEEKLESLLGGMKNFKGLGE